MPFTTNLPKVFTYTILTVSGIAIGISGGLLVTSNAQTNNSTSSSSSFSTKAPENNRKGYFKGNPELQVQFTTAKDALSSGDYEAWKTAVTALEANRPAPKNGQTAQESILIKIDTKEKFYKLAEIGNIMSEAKTKVDAIRSELGITQEDGPIGGKHRGFGGPRGPKNMDSQSSSSLEVQSN